jgi:3alpha(or 20beta)-hydroxysteroid dehydrogenase
MGRLDGKVALISGGARGQGACEARLFVAEGARVVIGDVLHEEGEKVADELGDAAAYAPLDVTSFEQWKRAVDFVTDRFGHLDVLVNNAGLLHSGTIESTSEEDYMRIVAVNQLGAFLGMKAVIGAMRDAGGGSIVNISSVAGLQGVAGIISYASTKWALRGMTKVAALELGRDGIRVNSVHPGGVDTPMVANPAMDEKASAAAYAAYPIPRIGQPEEIARLVLFLASDESSFSTGSEFVADGGVSAGRVHQGLGE